MNYEKTAITDLSKLYEQLTKRDAQQALINNDLERRITALEEYILVPQPPIEPPIEPMGDNTPDFCTIKCDVKYRPHIKKEASRPGEQVYFSSNATIGHDLTQFNTGKNSSKLIGLPIPPGVATLNVNVNALNNTGIDKRIMRPNGDSQYFSGMPNYLLFEGTEDFLCNTCDELWAILAIVTKDISYYPKVFAFQGVLGNTIKAVNAYNAWINNEEAGINTCTLNPDIHFTGC